MNLQELRGVQDLAEGRLDTPSAHVCKLTDCGEEMINATESPANFVSLDFMKTNNLELFRRLELLNWP